MKYVKQAVMIAALMLLAAAQTYGNDAGLEESYGYSNYVWGLPLNGEYIVADAEAYDHYMESRESLEDMGYVVYYLGNDAYHEQLGTTGKFRAVVVYHWGYYY